MLLSLDEVSVQFPRRDQRDTRPVWHWWLPSTSQTRPEKTPNALILNRLSLNVEKNDFLAILGPSGSGKTTLLRTIAGLTPPSSGRIVLNGADITLEPPHKREVSLVFQNGGWYDHLTVQQHFEFDGLSLDDIPQSMRQLDLFDVRSQRPAELSGGQAQRLAIGRALARNRAVLLLDEPLSQLDPTTRESLRHLLRSIHSQNRTLIYVTHDQNDAMLLATKLAVLYRGSIQQIGTPKALFETPNHRCVAEMIGQPQMQFFDVQLPDADRSRLVSSPSSPDLFRPSEFTKAIEYGMICGAAHRKSTSPLQVGVRPRSWRIDDCSTSMRTHPEHHRIRFEAQFVEERFMGHQDLLTFQVFNSAMPTITVLDDRANRRTRLIADSKYQISAALRDLHWFEPEFGNRLETVGILPQFLNSDESSLYES